MNNPEAAVEGILAEFEERLATSWKITRLDQRSLKPFLLHAMSEILVAAAGELCEDWCLRHCIYPKGDVREIERTKACPCGCHRLKEFADTITNKIQKV